MAVAAVAAVGLEDEVAEVVSLIDEVAEAVVKGGGEVLLQPLRADAIMAPPNRKGLINFVIMKKIFS